MAYRWNFTAPWEADQNDDYRNELLGQAAQIDNFFANNPQIPYNMQGISKNFVFYLKMYKLLEQ